MAAKQKIFVFSHYDLDGVVSYMVVKWFYGRHIPVKFTSPQDFRKDFIAWSKEHFEDYDRVYILDMDVSGCEDLIDYSKFVIIDHHTTTHTTEYKNAKAAVKVCPSAALLTYKVFSKLPGANYTKEQKAMVVLANDYDSYTLEIPQSYELNVVLFESQNKPFNFMEDFKDGFNGFNNLQKNIVTLHKRKLSKLIRELIPFHGQVKIQEKERHVVGVFASECINEIAQYIFDRYNADIAFVVNVKSNHVSFRCGDAKDRNLDVGTLAKTLCGGGGRAETAGGAITDKFMAFTKLLQPL